MPPIRDHGGTTAVAVDAGQLSRRAGAWLAAADRVLVSAARLPGLVDGFGELPAEVVSLAAAGLSAAAGAVRRVAGELTAVADEAAWRAEVARAADDPVGAMLALDFAPEIRLAKGEKYLLEDPRHWLRKARLAPAREIPHGSGGKRHVIPAHYDLPDDEDVRRGDNHRARLLYEWDPVTFTITYHLFYGYNNGHLSQNHEGDWERVTVQLNDRYRPTTVRYSAHGHANERDWRQVRTNKDGRPIVYSSEGSHANAPHAGEWDTGFLGFRDHATDGGERVDLARRPATDITGEPYYGNGVKWGERGVVKDTSGPDGPGAGKGAILDEDSEHQAPARSHRPDGWRPPAR